MQELQNNSTLQGGKYRILSTLGQGGFGITYLAEQVMLGRKVVAIKEFFLDSYCCREGETTTMKTSISTNADLVNRYRNKFHKEALNLAKLNHPNIVKVNDVFEENGTAYYVMDYLEGGTLADKIAKQGALTEQQATRYILDVAKALSFVHQNKMTHLDLKPANIMLDVEDNAVLIDFGLSKQYDDYGIQSSTSPIGLTEGYAPLEQYDQGGIGEFSPETDIYALGATFFKLLTGNTPPTASKVFNNGLPVEELRQHGVSETAISVIKKAMEPSRNKRFNSTRDFIDSLNDQVVEVMADDEQTKIVTPPPIITEFPPTIDSPKSNSIKFCVNGVEFRMIKVTGGNFDMREIQSSGFLGCSTKEVFQHVSLTDYWIAETQVTQALWWAIMGNNPSRFKSEKFPVECVDWDDCQKFITMLNHITKKNFRLPTEAEWEFAARGGIKSIGYMFCGSDTLSDVAWYEINAGHQTHDVATKQPNELGLCDMSGNVWEWCNDWYGKYTSNSKVNPQGPTTGTCRVARGGSWCNNAMWCRPTFRGYFNPHANNCIGLRLALSE